MFWYRVPTGPETCEFVLVDAEKGMRQPAFDHSRLAEALQKAGVKDARAERLPITELAFRPAEHEIDFRIDGDLATVRSGEIRVAGTIRGGAARNRSPRERRPAAELAPASIPAPKRKSRSSTARKTRLNCSGSIRAASGSATGGSPPARSIASTPSPGTCGGGRRERRAAGRGDGRRGSDGSGNRRQGRRSAGGPRGRRQSQRPHGNSPDGKWLAFVKDHNVWVKNVDGGEEFPLSRDGTADDAYRGAFFWSPDSQKLVAVRTKKGEERKVYFIESSPHDQVQPKLHSLRLPQARRPHRPGQAAAVRRGREETHRRERRAVRQSLEHHRHPLGARLEPLHVPLQPARAPGAADRGRRRRQAARPGRSSTSKRRRSSTTRASSSSHYLDETRRDSSGCRNATAGTTSTCTTPKRAR